MTIYDEALEAHAQWRGKIEVTGKAPVKTKKDLSLAYTPGVAQPCLEINKNPEDVYKYTWKGNTVAVVTDGTAVLGLGDIGPAAALPVMEGKALLFKEFADVDAVPLCLDTKDPQEITQIVKNLAPTFGGINLEDISAPRCVEIERALIEALDIPVFHDDQHGTAIVVTAALINALKVVNKEIGEIKVVMTGTGAAGSAIIQMLHYSGVKNLIAFNDKGALSESAAFEMNFLEKEIAEITNQEKFTGSLAEAMVGADVFIGVSAPGIVSKEMVASMNQGNIVFAMANPESEISYEDAMAAGATIVGTGRSDHPNQINNVLAFPGLFKGAFVAGAKKITENMKLAAAYAIADLISESELNSDYIIPSAFNPDVAEKIIEKVAEAAVKDGVCR
ncbi:malate dehydrogenase (oxaloacetate-decarboxylating) [Enterococcus sp. PF1-24]|uniref:NAD(P)-dependent malic enzyme n=1 Tax=unclassified Enterococcus TaxID=2608891 RepID=UPI002476A619|nr:MULTISPECIES: malic enzyme-like NAD(P)-binding protein [unclassified Enterococcus]MDH6365672.1 malate dehydrogenase (oxaloacetate-decarboxylating) [Enterococcus sp. PFB1-1]MDH6402773.1 malate dehydrogenase (oxaloacetate-decarboxylating) [Enterococcus sp. PF1-24]